VKTVKFQPYKYVGDPINAVKIFNEKEADELIVLDIDATSNRSAPDFIMIQKLAAECRMPLCYGGGVKTVEEAKRIIGLGVEKVAISSAALDNPKLISLIAAEIGSQSVVVVLDVKKSIFGKYEVCTHNGQNSTGRSPLDVAQQAEKLNAWKEENEVNLKRISECEKQISVLVNDVAKCKYIRSLTRF
jgi:cyclase